MSNVSFFKNEHNNISVNKNKCLIANYKNRMINEIDHQHHLLINMMMPDKHDDAHA